MKCLKCKSDNPPEAAFCMKCGVPLEKKCPHCGANYPEGAAFCMKCGAKFMETATLQTQFHVMQDHLPSSVMERLTVPTDGENRIVTVLLSDMSSSVEATKDLDPEDAADLVSGLLKAMIDVLSKYDCRIDNIVGDEVVAVFGAPKMHENDPERAIVAGLEIIENVQKIGLDASVGINTGEAYFGGIGSQEHQKRTVYGTVINLAARLQGQAQSGQVIVGETTYRHTRRAFEFEALSFSVKGFNEQVQAYRVVRSLPRMDKVRGIDGLRSLMIGRENEFQIMEDALTETCGGKGQLVSVIGEAGVGKSRLVAELKKKVAEIDQEESRPVWLEGRCLELGMSASYWPFIDIFREHFGWKPDDKDEARAANIKAALQDLVEDGHLTDERREEIGPLFGALLSVSYGDRWDEALAAADPEQLKNRAFIAVRDYILAFAKRSPLVVVLEDLHWSDSLSLDLISLLMESVTLASLLIICVYRPDREHKCWHLATIAQRKCPDRYTEISLRELGRLECKRLVDSLLSINNLPDSVQEMILEKTQGNPFFLEEVLRSLIDTGMVYQKDEKWIAHQDIETIKLPESVQSVVLSRIDRLEDTLRQTLQSASVIGKLFRKRLLEYTSRQEVELEYLLGKLEDLSLIYQERVIPEEEYSFRHVLTQETVYQNILRRHRERLHAQIAEAIESLYQNALDEYYEQLAYHWERAKVADKALAYLKKAGERALGNFANDDAMTHFTRALELIEEERRDIFKAELLFGLFQAKAAVLDSPGEELLEHLHASFDIFVDLGDTEGAVSVAEFPFFLGSAARGISAIGERALALVPEDSLQAGRVLVQYGHTRYFETGDYDLCKGIFDRAMVIARRENDRNLEMRALVCSLEIDLRAGRWKECLSKAKRATNLAHTVGDVRSEARSEVTATYAALWSSEEEEMHAHALRALEAAEKWNNKMRLFMALHSNLLVCAREGRWDEGREFGFRGRALSDEPSFTMLYIDWAVLEYQTGDFEKGRELVELSDKGLGLSKAGSSYRYAAVAAGIPMTALISGDNSMLDRAREVVRIVLSDDSSLFIYELTARIALGIIAFLEEDVPAAAKLYTELQQNNGEAMEFFHLSTDHLLALLAITMDRAEVACGHFEKSLELCRNSRRNSELAWVCHDYAALLMERRRPDEIKTARSLIDEGKELADTLAMRPLQERFEVKLQGLAVT